MSKAEHILDAYKTIGDYLGIVSWHFYSHHINTTFIFYD